jgi:hypothetical protein
MYRRLVWPVLTLGLLGTLVVLAVSACAGGGAGGGGQQQAKARPLPEYAQDLRPGEYHTKVFKPPLSFSVGKGWALECPEAPDYVCLLPPGEEAEFKFLNVQKVYKPSTQITFEATPAPEDLVGWFQQHPYLETDKPEPVTVGGAKGQQFDVVVGDRPESYEGLCGPSCVDLFRLSDGDVWALEDGNKARVTVVEDVQGETVTIVFGASGAKFDEFAPEGQKVVESLKWTGS